MGQFVAVCSFGFVGEDGFEVFFVFGEELGHDETEKGGQFSEIVLQRCTGQEETHAALDSHKFFVLCRFAITEDMAFVVDDAGWIQAAEEAVVVFGFGNSIGRYYDVDGVIGLDLDLNPWSFAL